MNCDVETFAILILFLLLKEEERQSRRTDSLTVPVNAMSRMRVSGGNIVFSIQNYLMETQENQCYIFSVSQSDEKVGSLSPQKERSRGREKRSEKLSR